jgi:hypothetical protein
MNGLTGTHLCDLQVSAGRVEACPEAGCCPFWDESECVVAGLRPDVERDPELTQLLLSLRARLARPEHRGWAPLRLLPPRRLTID